MILQFPRQAKPDLGARAIAELASAWLSLVFWWTPQPRREVIILDDYRVKQRKKANA